MCLKIKAWAFSQAQAATRCSPAVGTKSANMFGLTQMTKLDGTPVRQRPFLKIPPTILLSQTLVIAGGGGGSDGAYGGGGGGAGGFLEFTSGSYSLVLGQKYSLTVGAGGAAGVAGSNSVFSAQTALGGGRGRDGNGSANGDGGSGGGGSFNNAGGAGGATTQGNSSVATGFGYAGGTYVTPTVRIAGGGGGGAGAVGSNIDGLTAVGGNGGAGRSNSITGSSVARAGGGGGSADTGYPGPCTAQDGGGNGAIGTNNGVAGTANTGGGGGSSVYGTKAAGGSGLIILKISNTNTATFSSGVTSSLSVSVPNFRIYTITAAGVSDTVTFS